MISNLINRPCQIVRRSDGTEDDYGNVIPDETVVNTVCEFQLQKSLGEREDRSDNNLAESAWVVFFLVGTEVSAGDALIVDGVEYEVDGEPWVARIPLTQTLSHIEASVRRVSGSEDA